jgi:hypothetical protein
VACKVILVLKRQKQQEFFTSRKCSHITCIIPNQDKIMVHVNLEYLFWLLKTDMRMQDIRRQVSSLRAGEKQSPRAKNSGSPKGKPEKWKIEAMKPLYLIRYE